MILTHELVFFDFLRLFLLQNVEIKNKAASCDLDGKRGARVSVIIPVAANEKLRVRIFKTMGEMARA